MSKPERQRASLQWMSQATPVEQTASEYSFPPPTVGCRRHRRERERKIRRKTSTSPPRSCACDVVSLHTDKQKCLQVGFKRVPSCKNGEASKQLVGLRSFESTQMIETHRTRVVARNPPRFPPGKVSTTHTEPALSRACVCQWQISCTCRVWD